MARSGAQGVTMCVCLSVTKCSFFIFLSRVSLRSVFGMSQVSLGHFRTEPKKFLGLLFWTPWSRAERNCISDSSPVFRHGGHAGHIIQWFTEHVDCPVTGCTCKCAQLDPGLWGDTWHVVSVILTDRETYKLKFTSDLQANANMNCDRFEIKRFCSREKKKGHCVMWRKQIQFILLYSELRIGPPSLVFGVSLQDKFVINRKYCLQRPSCHQMRRRRVWILRRD